MIQNIAIIGGDLRIVKLAQMLAKDKINVKTYALEKAEELKQIDNIQICKSLEETILNTDSIICPIPISKNNIEINTPFSDEKIIIDELFENVKNKTIIAGSINQNIDSIAKKYNINIIDILDNEELVILNTIATAEGAVQIAMEETDKTIHRSNVLILGFGRVGKTVAKMFYGIGANVYCEARKNSDLAWIKTYGYEPIKLDNLNKSLNKFDIIINTIPALVIKKEQLQYMKKECLIIDLASSPGGVDTKEAEKNNIKTILALALPGKVAPITSAEYIKDTIYNILEK